MVALNISSIPNELYERIRTLADARRRSVEEEAVELLLRAVDQEPVPGSQAELLKWIWEHRFAPPPGTPDTVELIREDRDR